MPRYVFQTETDSLDSLLTAVEDEIDKYICVENTHYYLG